MSRELGYIEDKLHSVLKDQIDDFDPDDLVTKEDLGIVKYPEIENGDEEFKDIYFEICEELEPLVVLGVANIDPWELKVNIYSEFWELIKEQN